YRGHAVFVTADACQQREQLACGARVIMIEGEEQALRDRLAEARAGQPLSAAQVLPALREIFTGHATAVRLAGLAGLAGLPDRLLTGRQVAVLARVEASAPALARASLRAWPRAWLRACAASGCARPRWSRWST